MQKDHQVMHSVEKTVNYIESDFAKSIYPLDTNLIVIRHAAKEIAEYINSCILNNVDSAAHFLPQARCHAAKHGLHLRRTLKLDPVAEFYIYNIILKNKSAFRKDFSNKRQSFGHNFINGEPSSLSSSYRQFKKRVSLASRIYDHSLKIDIASYFNSLYHHDLVNWFANSIGQADGDSFGQFLREINSGRSIDCLPQGIHPCKVIGAEFLKFIDNNRFIKSEQLYRFMDDIFIFSDTQKNIDHDFILIQQLAGEKGLNFNNSKTLHGYDSSSDIDKEIEVVRRKLLTYRYEIIETYDGEEEIEVEDKLSLDEEQEDYLYTLLHNPQIDELDAELILTFMSENGEDVLEYLDVFFDKFPNLSKRVFYFCKNIQDTSSLSQLILKRLKSTKVVTEEQLFWFAKISEIHLHSTSEYSDILVALLEHKYATDISKSKILEIPDQRFGLPDIREEFLRTGRSDWLSWSSAVGTRTMTRTSRNHLLGYFSNASKMNEIICSAIKKI
jgi:hypothetical protein